MDVVYIYKIENQINHKVYIGQTIDYKSRIRYHKKFLRLNKHSNPFLQADYNKFGSNNFNYSILEITNKSLALIKEMDWINYYGGTNNDNTYNVRGNGKGNDNIEYGRRKIQFKTFDNFRNHKHTEESKNKISNSLKKSYLNGKHKISTQGRFGKDNSFYGKHHSNETKKYLSKLHSRMRKYSEEQIDQWILDYNSGLSFEELSLKYNCKLSSIRYIVQNKQNYLLYGLNNKPHNKSKKCNDYPEME